MPGSTPATSQLDWLISTTAMIVLSWSKATRDLLKSFGWGIRALHQLVAATMVPSPRRLPPYHLSAGGRRIRTVRPPSRQARGLVTALCQVAIDATAGEDQRRHRPLSDLDGTAWGLRLTLFIELKLR